MRRITILASVVCVLAALVLPVSCGAAEFRGLWVDAFHPGFYDAGQTSAMVAKAKECGFNALFVQVRRRGDVFYRSAVESMAAEVASGYDPLADIVEKAHTAGLEVHAWLSCLEVFHDSKWAPAPADHVYLKHPEWMTRDDKDRVKFAGDKVYLDPGLPEVRDYLAGIAGEIAANYKVDGIHLDSMKYPDESGGYNELSLTRYRQEKRKKDKPGVSDKEWRDWRRSQITELARAMSKRAKQSAKTVKLSASVVPNVRDSYYNRLQDWPGWLKEGTLDFAVPMTFAVSSKVFEAQVSDVLSASGGKTIYAGQPGWRLGAAQSVKQIEAARKAGAPGVVVFSYYSSMQVQPGDKLCLMDALKAGPFASQ